MLDEFGEGRGRRESIVRGSRGLRGNCMRSMSVWGGGSTALKSRVESWKTEFVIFFRFIFRNFDKYACLSIDSATFRRMEADWTERRQKSRLQHSNFHFVLVSYFTEPFRNSHPFRSPLLAVPFTAVAFCAFSRVDVSSLNSVDPLTFAVEPILRKSSARLSPINP